MTAGEFMLGFRKNEEETKAADERAGRMLDALVSARMLQALSYYKIEVPVRSMPDPSFTFEYEGYTWSFPFRTSTLKKPHDFTMALVELYNSLHPETLKIEFQISHGTLLLSSAWDIGNIKYPRDPARLMRQARLGEQGPQSGQWPQYATPQLLESFTSLLETASGMVVEKSVDLPTLSKTVEARRGLLTQEGSDLSSNANFNKLAQELAQRQESLSDIESSLGQGVRTLRVAIMEARELSEHGVSISTMDSLKVHEPGFRVDSSPREIKLQSGIPRQPESRSFHTK
jgi:hypothetical protein